MGEYLWCIDNGRVIYRGCGAHGVGGGSFSTDWYCSIKGVTLPTSQSPPQVFVVRLVHSGLRRLCLTYYSRLEPLTILVIESICHNAVGRITFPWYKSKCIWIKNIDCDHVHKSTLQCLLSAWTISKYIKVTCNGTLVRLSTAETPCRLLEGNTYTRLAQNRVVDVPLWPTSSDRWYNMWYLS